MEPKKLSLEEMEEIEGGWGTGGWLKAGCIGGGIALSVLTGPAAAAAASFAIHVCLGMLLYEAYM